MGAFAALPVLLAGLAPRSSAPSSLHLRLPSLRDPCFSGVISLGKEEGRSLELTQVFALYQWKLSYLSELFPHLTNETK